ESYRGGKVALVIAIEVDLESATDVGLVVREVVERDAVHFHGAVVPRRVPLPARERERAHRSQDAYRRGDDGKLAQSSHRVPSFFLCGLCGQHTMHPECRASLLVLSPRPNGV